MKKSKILFLSLMIVLAGALLLAGCGSKKADNQQTTENTSQGGQATEQNKEQEKQQEPITLKYAGAMPPTSHITELMNIFAEKVSEQTNNLVTFEVYPAGQLYDHTKGPEAVSTGAIDMAELDSSNLGGLSNATAVSDMAFLMPDITKAMEVHDKFFDLMDQEMQAKGVKLLFWMPYGTNNGPITKDKKIATLEDLKGVKMRAFGEVSARWLEAAGANPINISSSEVFQALSNGTVDGAMSGLNTYYSRKWYETANYLVKDSFGFAMFLTAINLDKWNSLPPDVQDIMLSVGKETTEIGVELVKKSEEEAMIVLENELEVTKLSEEELARWQELMNPIYEEWASRSPASREIMDYLLNN